jgi:hypothetical protein
MRRSWIRGTDVVFTAKELVVVAVGAVILGNLVPAVVGLMIILVVALFFLMTPVK